MSDVKIEQIKELIEKYQRHREERLSEDDVLEDFVARLFQALGWDPYSHLEWSRKKYIREGGYADVALQIDNKPVIFLEAKKWGKIRPAEAERQPLLAVQKSLFDGEWVPSTIQRVKRAGDRTPEEKQALRYARADVKVKWAILTNFERLLLFDADRERIILAFDAPQAYVDRFEDLKYLQRDQVAKGALDWYERQLERAEIDEGFYDFLLEWRKRLAQDIYDEDKKPGKQLFQPATEEKLDLLGQAVQRTLDRLIIIRYADDVGALLRHDQLEGILASYEAKGPYAVEYDLQRDVNTFYRAFYREHDTAIFASPHICEEVLISNKTMEALLADLTNISFRKFTSDILGNTYESYLGHKLKLVGDKIELEARRELRKGKGIYYTPTFIVRYIVDNTLGKYLYGTVDGKPEGAPEEGATRRTLADISKLGVLDPAMGSGSFLIYAFDVLADFYEAENRRIEEENAAIWDRWGKEQLQKGMFGKDDEMPTLQATEPNYIEKILQEHLYGVDLDREAVEIAGVNLIMRAFDRLKNEVGRERRKLPLVLRQNLKVGNSLISGVCSGEDLEPHREALTQLMEKRKELTQLRGDEERNKKLAEIEGIGKPVKQALNANLQTYFDEEVEGNQPFNWQAEFPEVFLGGGFDMVVGNPPYVRVDALPREHKEYFKDKFLTAVGKYDAYYLFLELALRLVREGGNLGFITPNRFCTNTTGENLRTLLVSKGHSVEATSVSRLPVFEKAANYPVITVVRKKTSAPKKLALFVPTDAAGIFSAPPSYQLSEAQLSLLPRAIIPINVTQAELEVALRVSERALPAGQLLKIQEGLRIPRRYERDKRAIQKGLPIIKQFQFSRYSTIQEDTFLVEKDLELLFSKGASRIVNSAKPKLIFAEDALRVEATLDTSKGLCQGGVYFATALQEKAYDLLYLLGLINSFLLTFVFKSFYSGIHMGGGFLRFRTQYLEELPIKEIDFDNPEGKAIHDGLVELAQRMLDLNAGKQKAEQAFPETLKGYERENVSLWEAYYDHSEYRGIHIECRPLIDANEKGEVTGIKADDNPDTRSLRIAAKVDDQWRDIVRLGIADEDFRLFLFFGLRTFLEEKRRKKIWARGRILRGALEALQAPVLVVAKADLNIKRIKQLMGEFKRKCPLEALHLSKLEATLHDTDAQIDNLVYELYGITAEECKIIKASLR